LQIECSSNCRGDCTYCYTRREAAKEALSAKEIRNLLGQAARLGIRQVDWIGGDPLERPDWVELMQFAQYQNMTNNVWTCGTSLTSPCRSKRLIELTRGGFVSTHLDSLDADILQSIRDSYNHNAVRENLKGLRTLINCGKPNRQVCNTIMLTNAHTLNDVEETMGTLFKDMGVRTCLMSLKPIDPVSRITKLLPPQDMVKEAYRLRDLLFLGSYGLGCQDFPKQYCGTTLFISLSGEVSPCYSMRRSVGSIRDHSLRDILARNSSTLLFENLRGDGSPGASCAKSKNGDLCWGCRANAFYYGAGMSAQDPFCVGLNDANSSNWIY
jgi:MoaA/NifB/PqqE/SkfB family radical SAM enzyme